MTCLQDLLKSLENTEVGHHQFLLTCIEIHWRAVSISPSMWFWGSQNHQLKASLLSFRFYYPPKIKSTMQEIWSIRATIPTSYSGLLKQSPWIKTVFIISFIYWLHQHPSPDGECSSLSAPAPSFLSNWRLWQQRVPLSILVATDVYIPYLSLKVHLWCCWQAHTVEGIQSITPLLILQQWITLYHQLNNEKV